MTPSLAVTAAPPPANFLTFLAENDLSVHLAALDLAGRLPGLPGSDVFLARPGWIHAHGRVMTGTRAGETVSVFVLPLPQPDGTADPAASLIFEAHGGDVFQWVRAHGDLRSTGPIGTVDVRILPAAVLSPASCGLHALPEAWTGERIRAVGRGVSVKRWALSVLLGVLEGGLLTSGSPFPKVALTMLGFMLFFRAAGWVMTTGEHRMRSRYSGGDLQICQIAVLGRSLAGDRPLRTSERPSMKGMKTRRGRARVPSGFRNGSGGRS